MSAWRPEGASAPAVEASEAAELYGGPSDGQVIRVPYRLEGVDAVRYEGVMYYRSNAMGRGGLRIYFYPGTEGSLGKEVHCA